jgi:hypothetical protein
VRNARAGLQHQTGHATDRDVRTHAGFVYNDKSAIQYIQMAFFYEQDRQTVFDRNGLEGWKESAHATGPSGSFAS